MIGTSKEIPISNEVLTALVSLFDNSAGLFLCTVLSNLNNLEIQMSQRSEDKADNVARHMEEICKTIEQVSNTDFFGASLPKSRVAVDLPYLFERVIQGSSNAF
jgi:hypothetical protein